MDFVNKAIASVTPSSTEDKTKVETPLKQTTPAGPGIVEKTKDTASDGASKVAGATADAIGATKEHADLDVTKGVGKHVDNAEKTARSYDTTATKKEEEGGVGGAVKAAKGVFGK